jgi:hypothetical protein
VTTTESKFAEQLEKLEDRIRIIPVLVGKAFITRSASSVWNNNNDDYGGIRGEVLYTGPGS